MNSSFVLVLVIISLFALSLIDIFYDYSSGTNLISGSLIRNIRDLDNSLVSLNYENSKL